MCQGVERLCAPLWIRIHGHGMFGIITGFLMTLFIIGGLMMANQSQQKAPDLVPINGSTNVYVGQRYVPKFYDDGTEQHGATWDKTKVYEPLTIVLWQGDSYTSRTFVPAGVEITDTQYWLQTGVFNAQLASVSNKLDSITESTTDFIKTAPSMKANAINKRIIVLGDSWANGYPEGDNSLGWLHYIDKEIFGEFYQAAQSGVGFASATNNWNNLLKTVVTDNPSDITDIYIVGGTNDRASLDSQVINGIQNVLDQMVVKYPNATLHVIQARLPCSENDTSRFAYACSKSGVNFISLANLCNVSGSYYWSRTSHPTNEFNKILANAITKIIIYNKYEHAINGEFYALIAEAGFTVTGSIYIAGAGNQKTITIGDISVSGNFNSGTKTKIATIASNHGVPLNFAANYAITLPVKLTGTSIVGAYCTFILNGTKDDVGLYIKTNPITPAAPYTALEGFGTITTADAYLY